MRIFSNIFRNKGSHYKKIVEEFVECILDKYMKICKKSEIEQINNCKKFIRKELYIYSIYIIDLVLCLDNKKNRKEIMVELFSSYFGKEVEKELYGSRNDMYFKHSSDDNCKIPHLFLSPKFEYDKLHVLARNPILLIDILIKDTIERKIVMEEDLYHYDSSINMFFIMSMKDLFPYINQYYEIVHNVK